MLYNKEEITEPFWADFPTSASGRDPLAIQNSSVVIYTKMMVGITNVTNRIRYNGFYCWLLELILTETRLKGSLNEQILYLRRAELLIAYMMVNEFPEVTGVSGSAFAARNISENINLSDGADWRPNISGRDLYWTFKGGIFGQYYSGVVRELGLINHPSQELNIYTATTYGRELGKAFGANLPEGLREAFWTHIDRGNLQMSDLKYLVPFALHEIPESQEALFYREMLLSKDNQDFTPTFYRKQTIGLLLKCLRENFEGHSHVPYHFLGENYRDHAGGVLVSGSAATAWYLYELNEILHVTLEHFHSSLLWFIDPYPVPLEERLDSLVQEALENFEESGYDNKIQNLDDLIQFCAENQSDIYLHFDRMHAAMKNKYIGKCTMEALWCLACVYRDCYLQLPKIAALASLPEYNFNRTGYVVLLVEELINGKRQLPLKDYLHTIFKIVINLHVFSSYGKTKAGQALVHNYMIEEGMIWRCRDTYPSRTTPRLQNTLQYMADVGWLVRNNNLYQITELGKSLITDEI